MSLKDQWQAYHEENPQIYQLIEQFAQQVIDRGYKEYSIGIIWERLRWHLDIETRTAHTFKFPNNHRAYYARHWMEQHPEHPDFFRTCALRSEGEGGRRDEYGVHEDDDRYSGDEPEQPDLF